jgi:ribulose-5-phosphate 4-epimerase/fuculose-1-phosphate aldolase
VFLKNHGVMVTGGSIAEAWDDLYYLERAAEVQVKAMSTGRPLLPIPPAVAEACAAGMRDRESARLHLESVKRLLGRSGSDFAA